MREIGPDTAKLTSYELGGRPEAQTVAVLRNLVTNLAEARSGDMVAAVACKRQRAAIDRTVARAEADALVSSSVHEEQPSCVGWSETWRARARI